METSRSGKLIVFEGLDGSGTTTQCKLLGQYLRKQEYRVLEVEEPGGTGLGRKIRGLLLKDQGLQIDPLSELLLYEASRAQLVKEKIIPGLADGKIIISDRFALSSVAYQGYGRGISVRQVKTLNEIATQELKPDLMFYLDVDLKEAVERLGGRKPDRIEQEQRDFYCRVKRGYLREVRSEPHAIILDGSLSKEEVSRKVIPEVEKII